MKGLGRYSGTIDEFEFGKDINYLCVKNPQLLPDDNFFKLHPDVFDKIAMFNNLKDFQLVRRASFSYNKGTITYYRFFGLCLDLGVYVNEKNMIADFVYENDIDVFTFVFSATEDRIYWIDDVNYNAKRPTGIKQEQENALKEIMHKIYGKE